MSEQPHEILVEVDTTGVAGVLAVSWEWDVPPGFVVMAPVDARPARLVVTIERIDR